MNWRRLTSPGFLVALVLLFGGAIGHRVVVWAMEAHLDKLPIEAPNSAKFHTLPRDLPNWKQLGPDEEPLTAEVLESLGTSNYLSRWYQEKEPAAGTRPRTLQLHTAYYTGMIDTVPHVPERCFVGSGGMQIDGPSRVVNVPLDLERFPIDPSVDAAAHGEIRRARLSGEREGQRIHLFRNIHKLSMNVTRFEDLEGNSLLAGYFFIANGGSVPTADDVRFLAFNLKDTYAYYAKVQVMSPVVDSAEELADLAADFLNEMLPEIMLRVPPWVEVEEGRYPEGGGAADTDGSRAASEPVWHGADVDVHRYRKLDLNAII